MSSSKLFIELESKLRILAILAPSNSIKLLRNMRGLGYALTRSVIAEIVEQRYSELNSRASLKVMDRLQML